MPAAAPDPFGHAADLIDPPTWEPADRPPLEPHQVPPGGRWDLWLLEAGRGAGKTEACARYFAGYMRAHPGSRGRIIAPTFGDAVEACIAGPSGLQAIDPGVRWLPTAPGGAKVSWPNGSQALVLGTPFPPDVDRLRAGGNRHLDWWEEMAANVQLGKAWDQAQLGLRLGSHPHAIASTTPRARPAYRLIRAQAGTVLTHATIDDNPHMSAEWRAKQKARYAGTRLGRQELEGELLEDIEGAMWKLAWIEDTRTNATAEPVARRVLGVDPGEGLHAYGLAVLGGDHRIYVTRSGLVSDSAHSFATRMVALAAAEWAEIVVERNHGGSWLMEIFEGAMREMGQVVPLRSVWASTGKTVRAEPVAALYEQGRVSHVGAHPDLEDVLITWDGSGQSPHQLDALVWAISDLSRGAGGGDVPVVGWQDTHSPQVAAWT